MLPMRGSSALKPDDDLFQWAPREPGESNLTWTRRQISDLQIRGKKHTWVLLVGGTTIYDFRLQVAQSQLRHDLTPSYWSHAAIISTVKRALGQSRILETSLEPHEGFQLPPMYNGIQGATLDRYADPEETPNIALIRVPVDPEGWRGEIEGRKSVLGQFAEQRVALDVPKLILEWLGFVWGAGNEGNPLLRGHGIPSAAVIEALIGATGYDLCPGLDSSACSPEAFWQTAKWWQDEARALNLDVLATRYFIADHPQVAGSSTSPRAGSPTTRKAAPQARRLTSGIRTPTPPRFAIKAQLTQDLFRQQPDK